MLYKNTTPRKIYAKNGLGCVEIKPEKRHVGMFYWCNYWRHWDKVLDVNLPFGQCEVVKVDLLGRPVEEPRRHQTSMDPAMFADKPFVVTRN